MLINVVKTYCLGAFIACFIFGFGFCMGSFLLLVNGIDQTPPKDETDIGLVKAQPEAVVAPAHATAVQPIHQPIPAPRKSTHSSTSSHSNAGSYN